MSSRTRPSETRALLRRIISFASPLQQGGTISESALESARQRIWESPNEVKQAFTPGAGVLFIPRRQTETKGNAGYEKWVVGRQPKRREGRQSASAKEPFELVEGEGRVWDGRVWFRVERVEERGEGWRWWVEEKGRWSLPVVMRARESAEGQPEVVLDFSRRGKGAARIKEEGVLDLGDFRISWRSRKVLR